MRQGGSRPPDNVEDSMAKRRKKRTQVSASARRKILAQMKSRGLTARKAARMYGVSMWTIYGWRKRKRAARRRPAKGRRTGTATSQSALNAMIRSELRALLPGIVEGEIARVFRGLTRS